MHGVFDVATMGLWEIVGTPIEGHVGKDEMFVLDIYYDKDGNIKKAELVQQFKGSGTQWNKMWSVP